MIKRSLACSAILIAAALQSHSQTLQSVTDNGTSTTNAVSIESTVTANYSTSNMLNGGPALTLRSAANNTNYLAPLRFSNFNANGAIGFTYDDTRKGSMVFGTSNGGATDPAEVIERMRISSNGNVGIGTASPASILNISGASPLLRIDASNNNAASTLQFLGRNSNGSQDSKAQIVHEVTETVNGIGSTLNFLTTKESSGGSVFSSSMLIDKSGNLGIGTTIPDQKLTVNGKIHTLEVIVDPTVPTPDYVFKKDYALRPLNEVEAYIEKNSHLPEVPSAAEVKEKGLAVGEMNMLLLKKIEELTLYMIEVKKESQLLKDRLDTIEKKN